jgi:phytoene/squalene synthetase
MGDYKLQLERSWKEVKEDLKENNIYLTDEDLDYQPGQEEQLLKRLEMKMNKPKAEIKALIESISFNKGKAS